MGQPGIATVHKRKAPKPLDGPPPSLDIAGSGRSRTGLGQPVVTPQSNAPARAVTGLPDATHFYFVLRDAVSPLGRTFTTPAADGDAARLRIALASCQHDEQGAYVAHRGIAAQDVDLVTRNRVAALGADQERWLARGLSDSECRWEVLAHGTQIGPSGVDSPFGRRQRRRAWSSKVAGPAWQRLTATII